MSELYLLEGHVFHARTEAAENSFHYPIMNFYFSVSEHQKLINFCKEKFYRLISLSPQDYLSKDDQTKPPDLQNKIKTFVKVNLFTKYLQYFPI